MISFKEYVSEAIKGWKHAHSDIAGMRRASSDAAKSVHLHVLKKDGTESGMHDARRPYASEEEARAHHEKIKELNPHRKYSHNLYVDNKLVDVLK
jgi:hypothetical protein